MTEQTPSELLASLLLGQERDAVASAKETTERGLWSNSVRLALLWRCVPRLRSRIAELHVDAGVEATGSLATVSAAAAAESAMVCRGAATAMSAIENAGVITAAFKGLGTIASIYRSPSDRMLSDADLLVRKEDFAPASKALREAGFHPAISIGFEEWVKLLDERVYPAHDFLDFVNADGVRIDLHWNLKAAGKGFSIDDILTRSVSATLVRWPVRVVSAEDSIILTANHLVRDRLSPRTAVKDLSDIEAWLGVFDPESIDDALEKRAQAAGFSTSLLACLRILVHYAPNGRARVAAEFVAQGCSPNERVAAERLARLFALQLRRGEISEVAVGLSAVTPALAGRFIMSRLRSLTDSKYSRHKFAGDDRLRTSARAQRFLRDVLTLTPERFRLYRALARENQRQLQAADGESH